MKNTYAGLERRGFVRLDYVTPLGFKVCKKKTIANLLTGYTSDISQSGLLCTVNERVNKNDILWLSFDRASLNICEELEKRILIYQNGIVGKVVWIKCKNKQDYVVGLRFITREEKNLTHIYPKIYFIEKELGN